MGRSQRHLRETRGKDSNGATPLADAQAGRSWKVGPLTPARGLVAPYLIVSPTGNDTTGTGTVAAPFKTLQKAHDAAAFTAGTTIYMRGGVYQPTTAVILTKDGTALARCKLYAYPGERPILDGLLNSVAGSYYNSWVLVLQDANYWHIKGIEIRNGREGGLAVINTSNNNIIEQVESHHNGWNSSFEGKGISLWHTASNNLILNCDSHHNQDLNFGNADGFFIGTSGTGNAVKFCRAWNNSDDGFDAFAGVDNAATASATLFEGNWAWDNGKKIDGSLGNGDGNGFKLGGRRAATTSKCGGHTVINNLAWNNKARGFDENVAGPYKDANMVPITLYNNTSYKNGQAWQMNYQDHVLKNNLSYADTIFGFIHAHAGVASNAWQLSVTVNAADFMTLNDIDARGPRQEDGSLPLTDFLRLKPGSDCIGKGVNVSLPFAGAAPNLGAR